MRRFFILIWLILDLVVGDAVNEFKKCDTQILNCPPNSTCREHQSDTNIITYDGDCSCDNGLVLNPKSTGDADYCIINNGTKEEMTTKSNKISNDYPQKSNDIGDADGTASAQFDGKIKSLPRPHHIVAGVLIPIAFVIIVVSAVFAYKKLHITQHIRNVRRTHRNRPFYEDVMLGSNDNDDPPLI